MRGLVPLWGAWESPADGETRRIERRWFKEEEPPFRRGTGLRLRVGSRAVYFGVMRHSRARSHEEVLAQRRVEEEVAVVTDITEWRRPLDETPRSAPR